MSLVEHRTHNPYRTHRSDRMQAHSLGPLLLRGRVLVLDTNPPGTLKNRAKARVPTLPPHPTPAQPCVFTDRANSRLRTVFNKIKMEDTKKETVLKPKNKRSLSCHSTVVSRTPMRKPAVTPKSRPSVSPARGVVCRIPAEQSPRAVVHRLGPKMGTRTHLYRLSPRNRYTRGAGVPIFWGKPVQVNTCTHFGAQTVYNGPRTPFCRDPTDLPPGPSSRPSSKPLDQPDWCPSRHPALNPAVKIQSRRWAQCHFFQLHLGVSPGWASVWPIAGCTRNQPRRPNIGRQKINRQPHPGSSPATNHPTAVSCTTAQPPTTPPCGERATLWRMSYVVAQWATGHVTY